VTTPVIVLGSGGHARVLLEALSAGGRPVLGVLTLDRALWGDRLLGVPVLGGDERLAEHPPATIDLVNGVGSTGDPAARIAAQERAAAAGYRFSAVVHPSAVVSPSATIDAGAQVLAGAVVQAGARIREGAILNTRASVDHDGDVGAFAHIAPGAVLCGDVKIGRGSHVGAGAVVIQSLAIGAGALVAAGSVVVEPVRPGARVKGNPAREFGA
jgi:UDP-perosamine 4-acetyltransferase